MEYTYFRDVFSAVFLMSLALVFIHCRHSNASFRSSRTKWGIENKGREENIRNRNIGGICLERDLELNDERSIKTHLSCNSYVTAINVFMKLRGMYTRNTLVCRHNVSNKWLCMLSIITIPVRHPWLHNFIQWSDPWIIIKGTFYCNVL